MPKRIGILTGGGDVPGLNAAIKSFVWRLADAGHEIIGLRRGWAALLNIVPDPGVDNSGWMMSLNRRNTRAIDRTGGTVLHTSRVNPEITKLEHIPPHLEGAATADEHGRFDLTRLHMRADSRRRDAGDQRNLACIEPERTQEVAIALPAPAEAEPESKSE